MLSDKILPCTRAGVEECRFWGAVAQTWSERDTSILQLTNGTIRCTTLHLTSFAAHLERLLMCTNAEVRHPSLFMALLLVRDVLMTAGFAYDRGSVDVCTNVPMYVQVAV